MNIESVAKRKKEKRREYKKREESFLCEDLIKTKMNILYKNSKQNRYV